MKKLIALVLAIFIFGNMYSQNQKVWMDVEIEYNMRLNNWFDNDEINKYLTQNSPLGIKGRLNIILKKEFGIFGEMAMYPILKKESKMEIKTPNEFDLNNFYLKNKLHPSISRSIVNVNGVIGLFFKTKHKKWNITPSFRARS